VSEFDYEAYQNMVKRHQESGNVFGWFESIYANAKGDHRNVFWADLEPAPLLLQWLTTHPLKEDEVKKKRAAVIGCGVGDDAEAISAAGYDVVAFDIAESAILLCKQRYTTSCVRYLVADLFNVPKEWLGAFDLIYECNTIQVLPGNYREQARAHMVSLLKEQGDILVSCRSRKAGEQLDVIPLPLDKPEMDDFIRKGLSEVEFLAYDDAQTPPVPHFWGWYKKI